MSSFITLGTYVERESLPTVEATSKSAIRIGILRAVSEGKQEGANLSAMWTADKGKRQGIPSPSTTILPAVAALCEKGNIDMDTLKFDVRQVDKDTESVVVYCKALWDAQYEIELSDDDEN